MKEFKVGRVLKTPKNDLIQIVNIDLETFESPTYEIIDFNSKEELTDISHSLLSKCTIIKYE